MVMNAKISPKTVNPRYTAGNPQEEEAEEEEYLGKDHLKGLLANQPMQVQETWLGPQVQTDQRFKKKTNWYSIVYSTTFLALLG